MYKAKKMKQGEYFEKLVAWINNCLHKDAIITPNDKLVDRSTGKKRQIDISIKTQDGPTDFLAIVEARDRSRPVGVPYVEQVFQKKESVKANLAIIVSNKGFYKTSIKKAKDLGIKIFSVEKALKDDWSQTIKGLEYIEYRYLKYDKITIYFLDKETKKIIDPHESFIKEAKNKKPNELIFLDKNNSPFKSFEDIINAGLNNMNNLRSELEKNNGKPQRIKLYVDLKVDDKAYFIDKNNNMQPIEFYCIVGDFWIEIKKMKTEITKYKSENNSKIWAEIIGTEEKSGFELLIETPDDIERERGIFIRRK